MKNMSKDVFKAPKSKLATQSTASNNVAENGDNSNGMGHHSWSPRAKRRRTKEDFYAFCNIVLAYTQYEPQKNQEELMRFHHNTSPVDSGGSTADSFTSESTSSFHESQENDHSPVKSTDEDFDLITCFCMKPFAGRPMIECSECLTWIHLSCAKIRRTNIPDEYVCQQCKDAKLSTRKSIRRYGPSPSGSKSSADV